MTKKLFNIYLAILAIFFLGITSVWAASASVSVNKDLVTIRYSQNVSDSRLSFYYGTTNNSNASKNVLTASGMAMKASNYAQISLRNGTYYFWVFNTIGGSYLAASPSPVTINNSCTNEKKTDVKGNFTVERCFIFSKNGSSYTTTPDTTNLTPEGKFLTCASGYKQTYSVTTNTCNQNSTPLTDAQSKRYCKIVYTGTCSPVSSSDPNPGTTPNPVPDASLASLSVSAGSLSPAFNSSTRSYKVSVGGDVSSLKITATASSGSSFVSGYGSRNVKLNYGNNTFQVRVVNSANKVTIYTLNINRADNRSSVNTLSNLTVNAGSLNPPFASTTNNYTINVSKDVSKITIGATLTDAKSYFATGYEPKDYELNEGTNKIYIKVVSEQGTTNVYSLTVIREGNPSRCTTETATLALLKEIQLYSDLKNVEIDQIPEFNPTTFNYNDLKVPYEVTDLRINAYVNEEGDEVKISGLENLEVNVTREVTITVTSKDCANFSNVYTLNVTRQEKKELSSNAELGSLTVKGKKEYQIDFQPNQRNYDIILKKGDTSLDVQALGVEDTTVCEATGTEELKQGSEITITCTAEDNSTTETYTITIKGVEKGTNIILIIILIIVIIIIVIYLILRLLGYKIYFNFGVIGAFFRGIGERIKSIFDK